MMKGRARILVVDDNEDVAIALVEVLELWGHDVRAVHDGPSAVQAAIEFNPDLAFIDLEIVRQGYGKVSTRAGEPYADLLRWYETRARELERGVWDQTDDDAGSEAEPAGPPARVVESPDAAPVAPAHVPGDQVNVNSAGTAYVSETSPMATVRWPSMRKDRSPSRTATCGTPWARARR